MIAKAKKFAADQALGPKEPLSNFLPAATKKFLEVFNQGRRILSTPQSTQMEPKETIAVDCSWANLQLERDTLLGSSLPTELLSLIRSSSGSHYLEAIASASLIPECTDKIAGIFRQLIPEITARWLRGASIKGFEDHVLILSCLVKILPFAPYLKPRVKELISYSQGLSAISKSEADLGDMNEEQLLSLLMTLFRLCTYDVDSFSSIVHPALLFSLFQHRSLPVRYVSIQCFSQVMKLADTLSEQLVVMNVGNDQISGNWEGKEIDFRLLKLFEERRWQKQERFLNSLESAVELKPPHIPQKTILMTDLLPETAQLGGVLLPRFGEMSNAKSALVYTPTTAKNIRSIGNALLSTKSILLSGLPGSGKTALVCETARDLNKLLTMVILHLNEQTDAKSLLGIYTSSEQTGSFVWQPGVLTQAVTEGRWVLIEDIDRAPTDVLSVIGPIIQDGELYLPSRKEYVKAHDEFRVFATTKNNSGSSKSAQNRHRWMLNERSWNTIDILSLSISETETIIADKFPALKLLRSTIFGVHRRVGVEFQSNSSFKSVQSRSPSLRDLLKWCRRISERSQASDAVHDESMTEIAKLDMFKDAVDCYASFLSSEATWLHLASCIAEEMQIPPQQTQHCLQTELPKIFDMKKTLKIGRATLNKSITASRRSKQLSSFAVTRQACLTMESIAAATSGSEPILLVGETGVGKTTLVQYVAGLLGQSMTVVNLSQQSEASDLLGGLKPVTTRSLMMPMVDQFSTLFDDTFSATKNEKFLSSIQRCVSRENWQRLLTLWQQAVQMAENSLRNPSLDTKAGTINHAAKRRKLATPRYEELRQKWISFTKALEELIVQVDRADRHLIFAFVEGRLVQAVRKGEWLLLDEINLASPDTLDSITSLLGGTEDGHPFLHLTEAGSIERVIAHPEFRIFAAMNPATDTGKKDLAPGIRSRFTEIYVQSADSDVGDLVNLIETYLGIMLDNDKRAAFDLANLYLGIKKMSQENCLTDGAGDDPHFTIRSLVRCLLYVQKNSPTYGLRRAVYEGANMCFCTMLSRDSERLILPLIEQHILSKVKNVRGFLSQTPKIPSDGKEYAAFKHHFVLKGSNNPDPQLHYIRTPSVEHNLLNLARATSMRRFPILLQGPTSSGKTSMVEYLAKCSGNKFVRVNNHEHTDLQEYLGSYASGSDGKLEYREGVLVKALREGHWIVLDELNLAPSNVLEALNRLLDDNRELLIPESQEIVRPHPGFMLFATQNPAGLYGGRKRFSRAFRNRFIELHFDDIPETELEVILQQRSQIPPSFCTQIVAVYKKLSLQRQSTRLFEERNSFATLRDLFRWASRPINDRTQLAQQGFMLLGERVRDATEREVVKATIEEVMRLKIDEAALYGLTSVAPSVKQSKIVWTPAMRRLFILVSKALENNEPVLLVGETGCGKTQICQTIAEVFQCQLNVYNAHTNTETGDLIGSQRPTRHSAELELHLRSQLLAVQNLSQEPMEIQNEDESLNLDRLIKSFSHAKHDGVDQNLLNDIRAGIASRQSLFEWADGSLVRAMKQGQHFLLDEISLADDSVLERLNSLLEPSRTILLAEKGPTDNQVIAAPTFQFLATMNPGGDYGKRELSAALRNRLTEIWVPSLALAEDILPIVESKLSLNVRHLGETMLAFASWFKEKFQGLGSGSVPLRDLITWAEFVQQNAQLEPHVALRHGAALVFIDSLGANPAGMMSSSSINIQDARQICLTKLDEISGLNSASVYDESLALDITETSLKINPFELKRQSRATGAPGLVFGAPTTLKNTMRIVRALQMNRPILLEGSPGVGKTAIVTALALAIGKPLTRINLSDQTDLMDLFGADIPMENEDIGKFAWSDGPILQAMQAGDWVLLDEMNLASQSVLEGLNSCLDHRKEVFIAELDKTFTCHPDFTLFAAQNPHQQGGGRKGLPRSFVNRFTVVYADSFEQEDLHCICRTKYPEVPLSKIKVVIDVVSQLQQASERDPRFNFGGPWEFNLRDVNRWLSLMKQNDSFPPHHYFEMIVAQRLRTSHQIRLVDIIRDNVFGIFEQPSLYHTLSKDVLQIGTAFLHRDQFRQTFQPSEHPLSAESLPYARSLIEAINQKWPVVLAGSSRSNPSSIVRQLAMIAGAKLSTLSLNADTDTMDLVGGFEQYDPRSDIMGVNGALILALQDQLAMFLADSRNGKDIIPILSLHCYCCSSEVDLEEIHRRLSQLPNLTKTLTSILKTIVGMLQIRASGKIGFVWRDGLLVDALQDGRWLVLENANTCNPAVLDRLNSLLEPNGQLIVNEQHSLSGPPPAISPHPDFRIFLSMDPRYGELSRAMRNRSLEIFVAEAEIGKAVSSALSYPCASSISRIRQLDVLDVDESKYDSKADLASVFVDHLSEEDQGRLAIPVIENLGIDQVEVLKDELQARRNLPLEFHQVSAGLQESIQQVLKEKMLITLPDFLLPIINDPARQICKQPVFDARAKNHAWIQGLLLKILRIEVEVTAASEYGNRLARSDQNLLIKSALNTTNELRRGMPNIPFARFFDTICKTVRRYLIASLGQIDLTSSVLLSVEKLLAFALDLLALSQGMFLQPGILQAYVCGGDKISKRLPNDVRSLGIEFTSALAVLEQEHKLRSGQSLELMWEKWRPHTASTLQQFQDLLKLEDITHRVDVLPLSPPLFPRLQALKLKLMHSYALTLRSNFYTATSTAEIEKSVGELEQVLSEEDTQDGHFTNAFRALCQLEHNDVEPHQSSFSVFARLSTTLQDITLNQKVPQAFAEIRRIAGAVNSDKNWSIWRGNFASLVAERVSKCNDQAISGLEYGQEEIKALAKATASLDVNFESSIISKLQQSLWNIIETILECHSELFFSVSISESRYWPPNLVFRESVPEDHYFRNIFNDFLTPAISLVKLSGGAITKAIQNTGRALVAVSRALLQLMVPDRPFDPALLLKIEQTRYKRRFTELQSKLIAQKHFELRFSGQDSSSLIRMTEEELNRLGERPANSSIFRPSRSTLDIIQVEFTNILRSVVLNKPEKGLLSRWNGSQVDEETVVNDFNHEAIILLQTIDQIIPRLKLADRSYDDMVKPVIWILESLQLGTEMIVAAVGESSKRGRALEHLVSHAPLLGTSPDNIVSWSLNNPASRQVDLQTRFNWLEHLAMKRSIEQVDQVQIQQSLDLNFLEITDAFYREWKSHLERDQDSATASSKYYEYRGDDDLNECQEREALAEMFPTFQEDEMSARLTSKLSIYEARATAVHLAQIQRKILFGYELELQDYVLHAMNELASKIPSDGFDLSPLSSQDLLPALILMLDQKTSTIQPKAYRDRLNIYSDCDILEAQNLHDLVQKTKETFRRINKAWPEHSVPLEVLTCCREIFAFSLKEPIAKLLTKTEKLYQIVAQWQTVASKEFSAAGEFDELTRLIIHWRRLELSSWYRLLELEQQKVQDNASAWYFIAYEAIIVNTRQVLVEEGDIVMYTKELARTLEEFFTATPIGEFTFRIRLVQGFLRLLTVMKGEEPRLSPMVDCVWNTLNHHLRYEREVNESLNRGRAELEKAIQEQIKLASWKDTNVTALRESAQRSHQKLFRIVRKYRALLGKPLASQKARESYDRVSSNHPLCLKQAVLPVEAIEASLERTAKIFSNWDIRPERLKNPMGAAARMKKLLALSEDNFTAHSELAGLRDNIRSAMRDLRSETPNKLIEENKSLVNHLKTLKQSLLTDTMRKVKQMGIRRDIGSAEMDFQSSTSCILATTPVVNSASQPQLAAIANSAFHELLDIIPQVRNALTHHSEEVRVADVRRGVAFIEGLLSLQIQQRKSLAQYQENLEAQRDTLMRLQSLAQEPLDCFQISTSDFRDHQRLLKERLCWLPEMLKLSCKILELQAKYAELDVSSAMTLLQDFITKFRDLLSTIDEPILLPSGLCRSGDIKLSGKIHATLGEFQLELKSMISQQPQTEMVLRKVIPWTHISEEGIKMAINGVHHVDVNDLDAKIRESLDLMFEAIQHVSIVMQRLPTSTESAGWLVKTQKRQGEIMETLQMAQIGESLAVLYSQLARLENSQLSDGIHIFLTGLPIIQQYFLLCEYAADQTLVLHSETAKTAAMFAKIMTTLASEGFCSPSDSSETEEQSGPVESGTGLGEGQGADDISKDIGEDEDLSELAQMETEQPEGEEMEASKDAVNMDKDDLKGQDGEAAESVDEDNLSSGDEKEDDSDLDEEIGSVDDLDPSAVDEKMWEGLDEDKNKEMENEKSKGASSEEQTATQDQSNGEEQNAEDQEGDDKSDASDAGSEGEVVDHDEVEKIEANLHEEKPLDLPDEMQLNGEENMDQSDISDNGLDAMSDIEEDNPAQDQVEEEFEGPYEEKDQIGKDEDEAVPDSPQSEDRDGHVDEDEIMEDQPEDTTDEEHDHETRNDDMTYDADENAETENGIGGAREWEQDAAKFAQAKTTFRSDMSQAKSQQPSEETENDEGNEESGDLTKGGRSETRSTSQQVDALEKLGHVLDRWHQRREIHQATENNMDRAENDIDMADADFEHLHNEEEDGDTQALGVASKDQAQTLDQNMAIEDERAEVQGDDKIPDIAEDDRPAQENMVERFSQLQTNPDLAMDSSIGAIVPDQTHNNTVTVIQDDNGDEEDEIDTELDPQTILESQQAILSSEAASQLWSHYSSKTQQLSLVLTEQLRLILEPTLATKHRGDFRTGKRLNIKRIIPYIASHYKRDKIWMRRCVPSKRNYQIMLALDDSKSMMEGGAGTLAFETLAMLCKSLSMLDVGDLCIVGFGNEKHVRVAHPFGQAFGNDAGVEIFRNFSFNQAATDVLNLVKESIALFQDARSKGTGNQSELWQLQLIISDGICEDHEGIGRLVRHAKEEKIMIVFVIVDSVGGSGSSILDLTQAQFKPDDAADGEMKLTMRRYLERFPFPYYLVVRDVRDLPGVLATALKGWFAQVVDVQG